jgi:general secretion pathway protein G
MKFQFHGFRAGRKRGFTLIELMMVILIIAILAGLILAISGIVGKKNDRAKAISDMEKIKNALEEYRVSHNSYPADLQPLSTIDTTLTYTDPWGYSYHYSLNGRFSYVLASWGPDNVQGTGDDVSLSQGSQ